MGRVPAYNPGVVTSLIAAKLLQRGDASALARAVEVSGETVSRWKSGESVPEPFRWPAIEKALGYEPGTFEAESGLARAPEDTLARIAGLESTVAELRDLVAKQGQILSDLLQERRRSRGHGK